MAKRTVLKADELRNADVVLGASSNIVVGSANQTIISSDTSDQNLEVRTNSDYPVIEFVQEGLGSGLSVKTNNQEQFSIRNTGVARLHSLIDGGVVYSSPVTGELSNDPPVGLEIVTTVNGLTGNVIINSELTGSLSASGNLIELTNVETARGNLGLGSIALLDASSKADLVDGKVPASQIPSVAITQWLGIVTDEAGMISLTGEQGDFVTRTDTSTNWVIYQNDGSAVTDWVELSHPADAVTSVNGLTGAVTITIPTKLSDLNDDINLATSATVNDLQTQVDNLEALVYASL